MPDRETTPRTPRWVKVFAIIAVVVILLLAILLLTGSEHGPRRHVSSGEPPAHTVPV